MKPPSSIARYNITAKLGEAGMGSPAPIRLRFSESFEPWPALFTICGSQV